MLWPKKGAFDNVNDLKEQAFYRFIAKTYWGHIALQFALLYAIGGWPWFVWLGCIRVCHHHQTMFSVGTITSPQCNNAFLLFLRVDFQCRDDVSEVN